jgi:CBS domain-containing protein
MLAMAPSSGADGKARRTLGNRHPATERSFVSSREIAALAAVLKLDVDWRYMMRCDELMNRDVECVAPADLVREAARRMRDANVGFLPVCDSDGSILGTVTDRDIAVRLVAEDRGGDTTVAQIMTYEAVVVHSTDDLDVATRMMREHQKSRIMCVDASGRLDGVISLSDIVQLADNDGATTLREISGREASP